MNPPNQKEHNPFAKKLLWISFSLYIVTAFLPLVFHPFPINYFVSTIYFVLNPIFLIFFFLSLGFLIVALILFSYPILFRIFVIFSLLQTLVPIIAFLAIITFFGGIHVGFITYVLAILTSLTAVIVYRSPERIPHTQTIVQAQKSQVSSASGEKVMFLELPEQEVKTLKFEDQTTNQLSPEKVMFLELPEQEVKTLRFQEQRSEVDPKANRETWFCGECGKELYVDDRFCEYCGFDLSEQ